MRTNVSFMSLSRRAYLSVATLAASSLAIAKTSGVSSVARVGATFGLSNKDVAGMEIRASDLELVTLTDKSVAFTWSTYAPGVRTAYGFAKPTVAADQRIYLGPVESTTLPLVYEGGSESGYHHVVIDGLEPGRTYRYECWSGDVKAAPSLAVTLAKDAPETSGTFTTLTPLEGAHLATIALTNDTHIGKPYHDGIRIEGVGLTEDPGETRFPTMQLEGLIETVKETGIDTLVVNGDCTDHNEVEEYDEFTRIMNQFGTFGEQWFVTRGNHDNHYPGIANTNGKRGRHIRKRKLQVPDYFSERFVPSQEHWSTRVGELRLIGVDTADFGVAGGRIYPEQMDAIRTELYDDPDRPTIFFAHHPMTLDAAHSHLGGEAFMTQRDQSIHFQEMIAKAPGSIAVFAGHTHRSRRGKADFGFVDYCERGASLGYPGGYTKIRVHEDGYHVSFHRTTTEESLSWSTRTRWSMFGLEPEFMLGKVDDRNWARLF